MKDAILKKLLSQETKRQKEGIELIPSENYASKEVRSYLASPFVNKYSEGFPKKRYYGGNEFVDEVEILAQERAKKLFGVPFVNVQPYSGSPANFAVFMAVCKPQDTIMGLNLTHGGHLTHGWKVSSTAIFYNSIQYHVDSNGQIDYEDLYKLARVHKPKLIWAGATAYVYKYDYKKFADIADEVGAYLAVDIAHVAGLIVGGVHPSPVAYAHLVTTTTHKTLRGPRGGMIMTTEKGLSKDPELNVKIDRAIFPGLQGGPHDNTTAAIAQALFEADTPEFKVYAEQIVKNAKALSKVLIDGGLILVGNGTENHSILVDLTSTHGKGMGAIYEYALDMVGLTLNKNTIPNESASPYYPSGVRLGTPAATSRRMREEEMEFIGQIMVKVANEIKHIKMPEDKKEYSIFIENFKNEIKKSKVVKKLKEEVKLFAVKYEVP